MMVMFAISTALVHLWPFVGRGYAAATSTVAASTLAIVAGTSIHAIARRRLLFCSTRNVGTTPRRSRCAEAHFELSAGLGRAAHLAFRPPSRVERIALVVGTVPAPRSRPPPLLGRSCVFWSGCGCRCAGVGGLSLLALFGGLAEVLRPRRCHGDKGTDRTHLWCLIWLLLLHIAILPPSLLWSFVRREPRPIFDGARRAWSDVRQEGRSFSKVGIKMKIGINVTLVESTRV